MYMCLDRSDTFSHSSSMHLPLRPTESSLYETLYETLFGQSAYQQTQQPHQKTTADDDFDHGVCNAGRRG